MKPAPFDYIRPVGLDEALGTLAEAGGDARVLAGGLSLVPMMNFRVLAPAVVVDIGRIEGLKTIADDGALIEVGAGVAQAELERWASLERRLPLLAAAFPHIGHYPTRARGTVGGSIAHADPSAELPLALAVLDGSVRLRSASGERIVPAREFFEGPLATVCEEDEMVVATRWPSAGPSEGYAFEEVALRHGDFAIAACAVSVRADRIVVGFGGVADTPVVREWPRLGPDALDDAFAELAGEIEAIGDEGGEAEYRRGLVRALGRRAVARAAGAAAPSGGPSDRLEAAGRGPEAAAPASSSLRDTQPRSRPAPRLGAGERHRVELVLNGEPAAGDASPRLLLSDFLRHGLGLRGVHVGCEHGVCGACTVRIDGAPARACLMFAVQAHGRRVETVEGLAGPAGSDARLAPLQEAFRRHHALQCGYCTPGMLMTVAAWLEEVAGGGRRPGEEAVRSVLSGHLCRCTGYQPIVAAVLETAVAAVAEASRDG